MKRFLTVFYLLSNIFATEGCTDSAACNYDPDATVYDGSCLYYDCLGECGGDALIDDCGECGGNIFVEQGCSIWGACAEWEYISGLPSTNYDECSIFANEMGWFFNEEEYCDADLHCIEPGCYCWEGSGCEWQGLGEPDCTGECGGEVITEEGYDCEGNPLSYEFNILPKEFVLVSIYPNPFNPVTKIHFSIPKDDIVSVKVYNINGKVVAELMNDYKTAGYHNILWNANNQSSGLYFVQLTTQGYQSTQKVMLIK